MSVNAHPTMREMTIHFFAQSERRSLEMTSKVERPNNTDRIKIKKTKIILNVFIENIEYFLDQIINKKYFPGQIEHYKQQIQKVQFVQDWYKFCSQSSSYRLSAISA